MPEDSVAPELRVIVPEVADVGDEPRMAELFALHRPHVVFHAAAHKHVPLLEAHPAEAVRTNVVGTANVLECANSVGAQLVDALPGAEALRAAVREDRHISLDIATILLRGPVRRLARAATLLLAASICAAMAGSPSAPSCTRLSSFIASIVSRRALVLRPGGFER